MQKQPIVGQRAAGRQLRRTAGPGALPARAPPGRWVALRGRGRGAGKPAGGERSAKGCREFAWPVCWGRILLSGIAGHSEVASFLYQLLSSFDAIFLSAALFKIERPAAFRCGSLRLFCTVLWHCKA